MFVAEGSKLVSEILTEDDIRPEAIFATATWIKSNQLNFEKWSQIIFETKDKDLRKISNLRTPNDVVLVHPFLPVKPPSDKDGWFLYLDRIKDPGNLGTILRIAEWFGIMKLFLSPGTVEIYNPKVIQASMGSFMRVPWEYKDFSYLKDTFPEKQIYLSESKSSENPDLSEIPAGIIVIGNESDGIARDIYSSPHTVLSVLAEKGNKADSLNAAVATGILLALIRYNQIR